VARYKGKGDPNDAANYVAVKGPTKVPTAFPNNASVSLLGPNTGKYYQVENGELVARPKP
jgi:hypothetical protein